MQTTHIDFSSYDVHPPGSYIVQAVWYKLNPGLRLHQWLRLLSVVMGGLFIVYVGLFAFKVFSDQQAVARSLLLVSIGTSFLQYATESRMYIFVMCLAAFACYAGVRAAERRSLMWIFLGGLALFLLPLFHYFACGVVPFVLVVWWMVFDDGHMRAWVPVMMGGIMAVAGAGIAVFTYALPQLHRIGGLLLPVPDWMSLVSGWFFGFQYVGDQISNVLVALTLIAVLLCAMVWVVVNLVREKKRDLEWRVAWVMFAAAIVVPAGLVVGRFLAYHHRYVMVELWMMVFIVYYVVLSKAKWREGIYVGLVALSLMFVAVWMSAAVPEYRVTAPETAFQVMAANIPCDANVTVVHETTFSYMPGIEYAGELRCSVHQVLATQMEWKWALGAGADAPLLMGEQIWTDGTFNASRGKYIYVNVLNDSLGVQNRSCVLWAGGGKLDERGEVDWVDEGVDYGGGSCNVTFVGRSLDG
jgi:hypothetical protein